MWLAVNEDGISVLDYLTMQPSHRYAYDSIVTFGGCQDDFMMVVITPLATSTESERGVDGRRLRLSEESSGTQRILFRTKKPEVIHNDKMGKPICHFHIEPSQPSFKMRFLFFRSCKLLCSSPTT